MKIYIYSILLTKAPTSILGKFIQSPKWVKTHNKRDFVFIIIWIYYLWYDLTLVKNLKILYTLKKIVICLDTSRYEWGPFFCSFGKYTQFSRRFRNNLNPPEKGHNILTFSLFVEFFKKYRFSTYYRFFVELCINAQVKND